MFLSVSMFCLCVMFCWPFQLIIDTGENLWLVRVENHLGYFPDLRSSVLLANKPNWVAKESRSKMYWTSLRFGRLSSRNSFVEISNFRETRNINAELM